MAFYLHTVPKFVFLINEHLLMRCQHEREASSMWMTWRDMCSGPASHRAATTVAATTRCLKTATCHARCSVVAGCTWAHPAKLKVLAGSPSHRRYGASGPPRSPADFRSTCCAPEVRCPCWLVTGCHWAPGDGGFLRPRPLPLCAQPAAVLPFCVSPSAPTPGPMSPTPV